MIRNATEMCCLHSQYVATHLPSAAASFVGDLRLICVSFHRKNARIKLKISQQFTHLILQLSDREMNNYVTGNTPFPFGWISSNVFWTYVIQTL
jgi:hypothetical protein